MRIGKELLIARGKIIDLINQFFRDRGFLRVETPAIYLRDETSPHIKGIQIRLTRGDREIPATLITSPEIYMKRLLSMGYGNIFQICHFYRDDEFSDLHNPEFLGLEFYEIEKDYFNTMKTTEDMIKFVVKQMGLSVTNTSGYSVDPERDFDRVAIRDLLLDYKVNLQSLEDREELLDKLKDRIQINESDSYEDIFFKFFLTYIEPHIGSEHPVFLYDYPPSMSSMAKISIKNGIRVAERYELYFNRIEICNGFTELNDPVEQEERLKMDLIKKGIKGAPDKVFIAAIKNLPPCSGNAVGLDRLLMVLLNLKSIKDIILFPLDDEISIYK